MTRKSKITRCRKTKKQHGISEKGINMEKTKHFITYIILHTKKKKKKK